MEDLSGGEEGRSMKRKLRIPERTAVRVARMGWLFALLFAMILFAVMEIANRNEGWLNMGWKIICVNIGTCFAVMLVLWMVTGTWGISCGLTALLLTIFGVVNLYSLEFRQMPISTRDIHNVRTAWNVLGAYEIVLNKRVIFLFGIGIILILAAFFLWCCERGRKKQGLKQILLRSVGVCICLVLFFYSCYWGKHPVISQEGLGWTWESSYYSQGFLAASVEVARQSFYKIEKPEGFDEEQIEQCRQELKGSKGEKDPDIILILNESWYDFSLITDFQTNEVVQPFLDNLDNCIRGYAVAPGVGGGTNSSEYELLTGNSLQLLQGITPFNSLHMDEEATVVTILKEQGYETTAFHPAPGLNYSRSIAYPDMDFDHIYFEEDVEGLEYWEQRVSFATDASNFSILRELYEENLAKENKPQFLYNLTIQNHGGYAMVSADKVPIQVIDGLSDMDEWKLFEMNEYLSCVHMTDQAFAELIQYYEESERPVIVCMVGDHCPTIAADFVRKDLTEEEEQLYLHSTPFVIWSNQELEEEYAGFLGMSHLMPFLLKSAGVSLSPYYRYIAEDLKTDVPIMTSFGLYLDRDGTQHSYGDNNAYTKLVNQYLYMEYWNLTNHKTDQLFTVPEV